MRGMSIPDVRRFDPPAATRREQFRAPTLDEVMEGLREAHGTKGKARIHLVGGAKPIVTTMSPMTCASQLSNTPETLLLIPRRDDQGRIRPAWLRAGAIAWVEEA